MTPNNRHKPGQWLTLALLVTLCVIGLLEPALGEATHQVIGRYLNDAGQRIVVELMIPATPPATILVTQILPPGIEVQHASPAMKKYNPKQREAKWLLDSISPGRLVIAMELNRPAAAGTIRGEIRYRDPITGVTATTPIIASSSP